MKKTMVLTGILILFAGLVIGQAVGTIITQTEFDTINFSNKSLEIGVSAKEKTESEILVTIDYTTLSKKAGNWIVTSKQRQFGYTLEDYFECRSLNETAQTCRQKIVDSISGQIVQFREHEREFLTEQKTRQFVDELNVNDLVFDQNNLNGVRKP